MLFKTTLIIAVLSIFYSCSNSRALKISIKNEVNHNINIKLSTNSSSFYNILLKKIDEKNIRIPILDNDSIRIEIKSKMIDTTISIENASYMRLVYVNQELDEGSFLRIEGRELTIMEKNIFSSKLIIYLNDERYLSVKKGRKGDLPQK
jgi:hypothetical protein